MDGILSLSAEQQIALEERFSLQPKGLPSYGSLLY